MAEARSFGPGNFKHLANEWSGSELMPAGLRCLEVVRAKAANAWVLGEPCCYVGELGQRASLCCMIKLTCQLRVFSPHFRACRNWRQSLNVALCPESDCRGPVGCVLPRKWPWLQQFPPAPITASGSRRPVGFSPVAVAMCSVRAVMAHSNLTP